MCRRFSRKFGEVYQRLTLLTHNQRMAKTKNVLQINQNKLKLKRFDGDIMKWQIEKV